jgi:hypothetical protein
MEKEMRKEELKKYCAKKLSLSLDNKKFNDWWEEHEECIHTKEDADEEIEFIKKAWSIHTGFHSHPGKKKLIPSENIRFPKSLWEMLEAFSSIQAFNILESPKVRAWRKKYLKGKLLSPSEAMDFLNSPRNRGGNIDVEHWNNNLSKANMIIFQSYDEEGELKEVKGLYFLRNSPVGKLVKIVWEILDEEEFHYSKNGQPPLTSLCLLILTGESPMISLFSANDFYAPKPRIELNFVPWLPAQIIWKEVQRIQKEEYFQGENRPLKARTSILVRVLFDYALKNNGRFPKWKEAMKIFNEKAIVLGVKKYSDERALRKDFLRGVNKLLGLGHRSDNLEEIQK